MKNEIEQRNKYIKIMIIILTFCYALLSLIMLPVFGDELNFNIVFKASNYYFNDTIYNLIKAFHFFVTVHGTFGIINTVSIIPYVVYELQYQMIILIYDFREISKHCRKLKLDDIDNNNIQKVIYDQFKSCASHYSTIKM